MVALLSAPGCGVGPLKPDGAKHSSPSPDYGIVDLPASLDAAGLSKTMLRSANLPTAWEVGQPKPTVRNAPAGLPCRKSSGPSSCAGLKSSGRVQYDDPYRTGTISIDLQAYQSRTAARQDYARRKASLVREPGREPASKPVFFPVGNANVIRENVDGATGEATVTLVMRVGTVTAVLRYVCNDACDKANDNLSAFASIQYKRIQYVQRGKTPPTRL